MSFRDAPHSTAPWWRLAMDRKDEAECEARYIRWRKDTLDRIIARETENRQQRWTNHWFVRGMPWNV